MSFPFSPRLGLCSHGPLSAGLPFYKKHPKRTGTVIGVPGGVLLLPGAAVGVLSLVGFTPAGVAAGNLPFCVH